MEYNALSGIVRAITTPLLGSEIPKRLANKVIHDFSAKAFSDGAIHFVERGNSVLRGLTDIPPGGKTSYWAKNATTLYTRSRVDAAIQLIDDPVATRQVANSKTIILARLGKKARPWTHNPVTSTFMSKPWIGGGLVGAALKVGAYRLFTPEAERTGAGYFDSALSGFASGAVGMLAFKFLMSKNAKAFAAALVLSAIATFVTDFVAEKAIEGIRWEIDPPMGGAIE